MNVDVFILQGSEEALCTYEKEFLDRFENGDYIPELLFGDETILDRIKNHPMASWLIQARLIAEILN